MDTQEKITIDASEAAQFEAFKKQQAAEQAQQKKEQDRKAYKACISDMVNEYFPRLQDISELLTGAKKNVCTAFEQAKKTKAELYDVKSDQRSHTFINAEQNRRVMLGHYEIDEWDDTAAEGEAMVKEYMASLAKDAQSAAMVKGILKLLAKDKAGKLKVSSVMKLREMATDLGAEQFLDGVRVMIAAHRPAVSKTFVRAEYKNELGAWVNVPLGMTEA